jgi:hypothetical protein
MADFDRVAPEAEPVKDSTRAKVSASPVGPAPSGR